MGGHHRGPYKLSNLTQRGASLFLDPESLLCLLVVKSSSLQREVTGNVDVLCLLQDPKMLADLDSRGSGNLDSRTVTICSGLDFVNISYNNFVASDEKTAKVRRVELS